MELAWKIAFEHNKLTASAQSINREVYVTSYFIVTVNCLKKSDRINIYKKFFTDMCT